MAILEKESTSGRHNDTMKGILASQGCPRVPHHHHDIVEGRCCIGAGLEIGGRKRRQGSRRQCQQIGGKDGSGAERCQCGHLSQGARCKGGRGDDPGRGPRHTRPFGLADHPSGRQGPSGRGEGGDDLGGGPHKGPRGRVKRGKDHGGGPDQGCRGECGAGDAVGAGHRSGRIDEAGGGLAVGAGYGAGTGLGEGEDQGSRSGAGRRAGIKDGRGGPSCHGHVFVALSVYYLNG